jgi:hypothetical protein
VYQNSIRLLCVIALSYFLISCNTENKSLKVKANSRELALGVFTPPVEMVNQVDSILDLNKARLEKAINHALWEKSIELFELAYPQVENISLDSNSCLQIFQILMQKVYLLERIGRIEEAFLLQSRLGVCAIERSIAQKKMENRVLLLKVKWDTWPTVLSPHFSVRVEGEEAYNSLPKVLSELEETARILGEVLNVSLIERIPLRLFKSSPQKTEAWYDGALVVALDWIENDSLETVKILRHELMHAFLTQVRGKDVPRWYHEGMARNFEDLKISVVDYEYESELAMYKNLNADFRAKNGALKKAYILANARIHCWIENKGIDEFINVLNNVSLNLEDEFPYECAGEDILGY